MARPAGAGPVDLDGSVHAAWSDASWGDLRPTGPGRHDGGPLADFATEVAAPSGARFDQLAWATQVHGRQVVAVGGNRQRRAAARRRPSAATSVRPTPWWPSLPARPWSCSRPTAPPWRSPAPRGVRRRPCRLARSGGRRGGPDRAADAGPGGDRCRGVLGPCIHALGCYEFGDADLDTVSDAFGPSVRGTTRGGAPALDLVAGVRAAPWPPGPSWSASSTRARPVRADSSPTGPGPTVAARPWWCGRRTRGGHRERGPPLLPGVRRPTGGHPGARRRRPPIRRR